MRPVEVAFSLYIKIHGGMKEFNFRQRNANLFDANTNDEYSARTYFHVQKEDSGHWKILGDSIPAWVLQNEGMVSEALEKKLQGS
jgi:hypothetical protein